MHQGDDRETCFWVVKNCHMIHVGPMISYSIKTTAAQRRGKDSLADFLLIPLRGMNLDITRDKSLLEIFPYEMAADTCVLSEFPSSPEPPVIDWLRHQPGEAIWRLAC